MSFDSWKEAGPHDDCGSTEQVTCSEPGCREPWAWESGDGELLCEAHSTEWLLRVRRANEVLDELLEDLEEVAQ
jgi:hypothetical protein